ncbi:Hypothetical predicted protein [Paramuricea clavata]|uniref:Uncharacterized protein n=1 Tax=Paramuricea clavata TaxID=317549 RepID=A0A6S7IBR2_PARCT|nr:Hypothetical predicted protein [Paramuricea clavata]
MDDGDDVDLNTLNNSEKIMYRIPIEWISRLAVRDGMFVLLPQEFCCREVLLRSKTQLVRCQSLNLRPNYYDDEKIFHVGCGPCNLDNPEIEVFAGTTLYIGLTNLMTYFETGLYLNVAEMLVALEASDKTLHYYTEEWVTTENEDDQSVEHHPYPAHRDIHSDGFNSLGIPIYRFVLDADFDSLRDKSFYGVVDNEDESPCLLVDTFMFTYVVKKK